MVFCLWLLVVLRLALYLLCLGSQHVNQRVSAGITIWSLACTMTPSVTLSPIMKIKRKKWASLAPIKPILYQSHLYVRTYGRYKYRRVWREHELFIPIRTQNVHPLYGDRRGFNVLNNDKWRTYLLRTVFSSVLSFDTFGQCTFETLCISLIHNDLTLKFLHPRSYKQSWQLTSCPNLIFKSFINDNENGKEGLWDQVSSHRCEELCSNMHMRI